MGRGQSPLPFPRRWGKPGGGHGPACRGREGAAGGSGGAERGRRLLGQHPRVAEAVALGHPR